MSEETKINWIDEMIQRESVPQAVREETVEKFCERHSISVGTYYYHSSKEENIKKSLELSLNTAKKEVPEVLQVLLANAKKGREKSIEMYMDYVLKLSKNLDIKSDGKPLISIDQAIASRYALESLTTDNSERPPSV